MELAGRRRLQGKGGIVAYGQYSNAKDPVSSNIFLVNANQNFDLTQATQWEAGLKADVDGGRTQVTLAYFEIARDDVLERFALDSATNIGGIKSKGLELAGTFRLGGPGPRGCQPRLHRVGIPSISELRPVRRTPAAQRAPA